MTWKATTHRLQKPGPLSGFPTQGPGFGIGGRQVFYSRLGCRKRYVSIPDCGHWTIYPEQLNCAVGAIADWFTSIANTLRVTQSPAQPRTATVLW